MHNRPGATLTLGRVATIRACTPRRARSYLSVLEAVPPIYDKLFPAAVAGIMKGDITGGVGIVREAMGTIPGGKGATLAGMIKYHISTLGKEKCAAEKKNGTKVCHAPPPRTACIRTPRPRQWFYGASALLRVVRP